MLTEEQLSKYKSDLYKYYSNKYFMTNPNDWQRLAQRDTDRDYNKYLSSLQNQETFNGGSLDGITVTPQGTTRTTTPQFNSNIEKTDPDVYHGPTEEEKAQTNELIRDIHSATDKWGKGLGLTMTAGAGLGVAAGAMPYLSYLAPGTAGGNFIGNAAKDMLLYEGFNHGTKALTGTTLGDQIRLGLDKASNGKIPQYFHNQVGGDVVYDMLTETPTFALSAKAAPLLEKGVEAVGKVAAPVYNYGKANAKYAIDTRFKGVPEGGNMEAYVPEAVKTNVKVASGKTMQTLKDLGVTDLPEIKLSFENMPMTASTMGSRGTMHVGFSSKQLHNPKLYWKAYNDKPGLGLNYSFVGGHEPAHLVHPHRINYYEANGDRVFEEYGDFYVPKQRWDGLDRQLPIGDVNAYRPTPEGKFNIKSDEYFPVPKELDELGMDLFKDLKVPRKNIMPGLPNSKASQIHLLAPQEFDADLYYLKNIGEIKDGELSEDAIQFLMQRHNLSREGVENTLENLKVIDYANAVTGDPINTQFVPGGGGDFAGSIKSEVPKVTSEATPLTTHLQGDDAVKMFKEYGGEAWPEGSINGDQLMKYVPEARERYGIVGRTDITDEEIAQALYKHSKELGGNTAAVNAQGEPQLLFRGDTYPYTELKTHGVDTLAPGDTPDNVLGTLFLDKLNGKSQGIERYLYTSVNGIPVKLQSGSSPAWNTDEEMINYIKNNFNSSTLQPSYEFTSIPHHGERVPVYKLKRESVRSGANDVNAFVVRTPKVRNATEEIGVIRTSELKNRDMFPEGREGDILYNLNLIDDAKANNQGLLKSEPAFEQVNQGSGKFKSIANTPKYRDEHDTFTYFALPDFNAKNAKHLLPYDLRIPRNWNDPNIYRAVIPAVLTTGVATKAASEKRGGKLNYLNYFK